MGLQLAQGRWFDAANATDSRNVVLNETAIKELGIHIPVLGQSFSIHGKTGQIIGVLKDFKYKSMHDKTGPLVIFIDPSWWNFLLIKTTPQGTSDVVQTVKEVWNKTLPGQPMEYSFMDDQFNNLYSQDQLASMLVLTFSIIAVIISAMGLFGLAAFEAERRTKELGIRKILGASLMDIGLILSSGFLRLIGLAILISFPLAWWTMTKWLDNFAYRINMQWWMLGLSGGLILLVTLGITGYHTLKASVINPVKSLRPE
jgi:putative ABC transport system permease protein